MAAKAKTFEKLMLKIFFGFVALFICWHVYDKATTPAHANPYQYAWQAYDRMRTPTPLPEELTSQWFFSGREIVFRNTNQVESERIMVKAIYAEKIILENRIIGFRNDVNYSLFELRVGECVRFSGSVNPLEDVEIELTLLEIDFQEKGPSEVNIAFRGIDIFRVNRN